VLPHLALPSRVASPAEIPAHPSPRALCGMLNTREGLPRNTSLYPWPRCVRFQVAHFWPLRPASVRRGRSTSSRNLRVPAGLTAGKLITWGVVSPRIPPEFRQRRRAAVVMTSPPRAG
jgi:hypothetical protein